VTHVDSAAAQTLALATGALLVTAALLVWRRSLAAAARILAVQGAALAFIVVAIALAERDVELGLVAVLVLALKAVVIPAVVARGVRVSGVDREESPRLNPTAGLVAVIGLTMDAYLVGGPIGAAVTGRRVAESGPGGFAVPAGLTLVLVGLLLVVTRRRVISQLVGFLVLDNGIAAVAFLTAAGVPFVVELGVSLDVLLVALILAVLSGRLHAVLGSVTVDELDELRD
jgi:hydrogenase-4 component E